MPDNLWLRDKFEKHFAAKNMNVPVGSSFDELDTEDFLIFQIIESIVAEKQEFEQTKQKHLNKSRR